MSAKVPLISRSLARAGFHVGAFLGGFKIGASASGWEGHESSRQRRRSSRENLESQDAGLNYGVRETFISEARKLGQTYPIVRRIKRQYANHCVGSCRIKWNTGDKAIDALYNSYWQSWMAIADVNGVHHFKKLTKIVVSSTIGDGDIFGQLVESDYGQIRLIEGDRVSSDGNFNSDSETMIGGMLLSNGGRPAAIRVWNRNLYGTFTGPKFEIPMSQIAHVFDSDRADAYRGITHFHTVLNALKDLKETTLAEKLSAKRNSKLALLIKSVFGGAKAPAVDLFGDGETSNGSGSTKVDVHEVNDVTDAYMFPQEDIKAHSSDRPSDGWHKLMEWMVREIATGLDLPFGVVWHMAGLGGPAARFEINQAKHTFTAFTEILEQRWIRKVAGWVVAKAINDGRLPFTPGWYQFKVARPAYISIDMGRDSKAGIAENTAGLYSATSWYAETDDDFEEETDRLVYEAKYRIAKCKGVDISTITEIPLEQIRIITAQGNPAENNARQTQPSNQDDE